MPPAADPLLSCRLDGRCVSHTPLFVVSLCFFFITMFHSIPLAKKLKDCGVFGVSSGEYLNYAVRNRSEWEERGQQVVSEMMTKLEEWK